MVDRDEIEFVDESEEDRKEKMPTSDLMKILGEFGVRLVLVSSVEMEKILNC